MKKQHSWQRQIAAALAALLLITAWGTAALANETAPGLVEGVTWDTTLADIIAAEGADSATLDVSAASTPEGGQYGFMHPAEGEEPARYFFYAFREDKLIAYGCSMMAYYQAEGTEMAVYYDVQLERFTKAFGEPAAADADWLALLSAGYFAGAEVQPIAYSAWEIPGETILLLMNMDDMNIMYMFLNRETLYSELEQE